MEECYWMTLWLKAGAVAENRKDSHVLPLVLRYLTGRDPEDGAVAEWAQKVLSATEAPVELYLGPWAPTADNADHLAFQLKQDPVDRWVRQVLVRKEDMASPTNSSFQLARSNGDAFEIDFAQVELWARGTAENSGALGSQMARRFSDWQKARDCVPAHASWLSFDAWYDRANGIPSVEGGPSEAESIPSVGPCEVELYCTDLALKMASDPVKRRHLARVVEEYLLPDLQKAGLTWGPVYANLSAQNTQLAYDFAAWSPEMTDRLRVRMPQVAHLFASVAITAQGKEGLSIELPEGTRLDRITIDAESVRGFTWGVTHNPKSAVKPLYRVVAMYPAQRRGFCPDPGETYADWKRRVYGQKAHADLE